MNCAIIAAAAARRQGHGRGEGARAPAALGQARRDLGTVPDRDRGGAMTPAGYRTATARLPRLLADLAEGDPRRQVAAMLADAVERIGAVAASPQGGRDHSGGVSDGGATTRVKHAERLRRIRAAVNGWPLRSLPGAPEPAPRIVLGNPRRLAGRKEIRAFPPLIAVVCDGRSLRDVIEAAGWCANGRTQRRVTEAALECLDDAADALGLGRAEPRRA